MLITLIRLLVLMMADLYGLLYYLHSFYSHFIYNGHPNKMVMTSSMVMKREDLVNLLSHLIFNCDSILMPLVTM